MRPVTHEAGGRKRLRRLAVQLGLVFAAVSLMVPTLSTPVAAAASITVTVNQFLNVPWAIEGVSKSFAIASFTDTNACTGPGACNCLPAGTCTTEYTAMIDWGDHTPQTAGTVAFVSESSNNTTATYSVTANHEYVDEYNCPVGNPVTASSCGFPVHVQVTNNINTFTSGNGCPPYPVIPFYCVAVKDQPLDKSVPAPQFTAFAGVTFGGQIGAFHDENNKAIPLDGGLVGSEYTVTIKSWGDLTGPDPTPGTFTIVGCDPSNPGPAPFGCNVLVNVGPGETHAYAVPGTYTVIIDIQDGANKKLLEFLSTAHVFKARSGPAQTAPAGSHGRNIVPSAPASPAPRTIAFRHGLRAFVVQLSPSPRDFVDTPVYRFPTAI
jgi:hypothetical protein